MNDVADLNVPKSNRNADPVPEGIELENAWETKTIIRTEEIILAQAGWIAEQKTVGTRRKHPPRISNYKNVRSAPNLTREDIKSSIGWCLQIYKRTNPVDSVRIIAKQFNFDYQNIGEAGVEARFALLLKDLAKVFGVGLIEAGFKQSMGSCDNVPEIARTLQYLIPMLLQPAHSPLDGIQEYLRRRYLHELEHSLAILIPQSQQRFQPALHERHREEDHSATTSSLGHPRDLASTQAGAGHHQGHAEQPAPDRRRAVGTSDGHESPV